jgi:hypothetical protein
MTVGVGELAFQVLNRSHQRFTRALQRVSSLGHRDSKCRISEVSWVLNSSPILLRLDPTLELGRRSVEVGHCGFHLGDPPARIFDSCLPQSMEFIRSYLVLDVVSVWVRNLVEGCSDTKLRSGFHRAWPILAHLAHG